MVHEIFKDKLKAMIEEMKKPTKERIHRDTKKFREGFVSGLEHALLHLEEISKPKESEYCLHCYHPTKSGVKFCGHQCEFSYRAR